MDAAKQLVKHHLLERRPLRTIVINVPQQTSGMKRTLDAASTHSKGMPRARRDCSTVEGKDDRLEFHAAHSNAAVARPGPVHSANDEMPEWIDVDRLNCHAGHSYIGTAKSGREVNQRRSRL